MSLSGLVLDTMRLLAGMPAAQAMLADVRQHPARPVIAGVLSPGGCGKTALLDSLREVYRAADIPILDRSDLARPPGDPAHSGVLLLDDAHRLSAPELVRAHEIIRAGTSVVLTFRPWPRTAELIDTAALVRRSGPLLVLGPLAPAQTTARMAVLRGVEWAGAATPAVHRCTAGHPVLVDLLLDAIPAGSAAPVSVEITEPMVERAEHLLLELDDPSRRVLHALSVGADPDSLMLSDMLDLSAATTRSALEQLRAAGLLPVAGRPAPLIERVVLATSPRRETDRLRSVLLSLHHQDGRDVLDLATTMVRSGIRGGRLAGVLVTAADRELVTNPKRSLELYDQAIVAGAEPAACSVRMAHAAALNGESALAARLIDDVLAVDLGPDLSAAIDVAATVAAQGGDLRRAAELYSWLGAPRMRGAAAAFAVLAMVGTGAAGPAEEVMQTLDGGTPTALASMTRGMAAGIWASIADSSAVALATVSRAAALFESSGARPVLLPDSPSALTALLAIHTGHLDTAGWATARAVDLDLGGPVLRVRHRLLRGWVAMLDGRVDEARSWLAAAADQLDDGGWAGAGARDQMLRWGLEIGLARRTGDGPGMVRLWSQIRELVLRQPVDLYLLLPVAEFVVVAARLREPARMSPMLDEARELLTALGNPIVWSAPLHWAGVQAAVLLEDPGAIDEHALALLAGSSRSEVAADLARASTAWAEILDGTAGATEIQSAARGLASRGLAWDGSRLLAQAAARTTDRRAATVLLQAAREMTADAQVAVASAAPVARVAPSASSESSASGGRVGAGSGPAGRTSTGRPSATERSQPAPGGTPGDRLGLSDREVEVARLLIDHHTYADIGARLFISPKTVEHHVARIKRRVGATGRTELLDRLRGHLGSAPGSTN